MSSQGPNFPAAATSISNAAWSTPWTSPTNVGAADSTYASWNCGSHLHTASYQLTCTGYGFSIPSGATVNGITVVINRRFQPAAGTFTDGFLLLTKDGTTPIGTDHADTVTNWTGVQTSITYGSSSDLWGSSWSDTEINSANFGVCFNCMSGNASSKTAFVDYITIIVTYTAAASASSKPTPSLAVGFSIGL